MPPSNFNSPDPNSAFWFVELPSGVVQTTWRRHEFTKAVQRAAGMTPSEQDGRWGPRTVAALNDALLWTSNANGARYRGDASLADVAVSGPPVVTPQILQAAIWLLNFGTRLDIPFGRIKVPSNSVMPPWGQPLPHPTPDQLNVDTPMGDAMRPYDVTETSVPTVVIQHAEQSGAPPAPTAATPTVSQPPVPVVRPLGLQPTPYQPRPTGVSVVAVVGVIGAVVVLGAIAVSLSRSPSTQRTRTTARATRRRR